jgi:hypothetical protein
VLGSGNDFVELNFTLTNRLKQLVITDNVRAHSQ